MSEKIKIGDIVRFYYDISKDEYLVTNIFTMNAKINNEIKQQTITEISQINSDFSKVYKLGEKGALGLIQVHSV
jgi:hypothetical protein